MGTDKTIDTNVKGVDFELHKAIKNRAMDKGITANDVYLKIIKSGAKRLKIDTKGK